MNIGEEKKEITFEPVELPEESPAPPAESPVPVPVPEEEPVGV